MEIEKKDRAFYISREEYQDLLEKCPWRVAFHTVIIWGVYASLAFIAVNYAWGILAWPLMGFILSGNMAAAHDCLHNSHYRQSYMNRVFGAIWCVPIFMNYSLYKIHHMTHHRYTGVEGDSEPKGEFISIRNYIKVLTGVTFLKKFLMKSLKAALGIYPDHVSEDEIRNIKLDNLILLGWLVVISVVTIIWPVETIRAYWGALLFYPACLVFIGIAEHYGCDESADIQFNTRTMSGNPVLRFFIWNSNYHAEHHVYSAVPTLRLGALHKKISQDFKFRESSYLAFHRKIYKSLKEKGV